MTVKKIQIALYEPHAGQKRILENKRRFNAIPCARRFGKTELMTQVEMPLIEPAVFGGGIVGIFVPVLKDFARSWQAIKDTYAELIPKGNIDNTKYIIRFAGGGELYVFSLSDMGQRDNGRGWKFHRVIYEETQKIPDDVLRYHWTEVVRPTLSDYKGDAFFIGTADGKTSFWYRICQRGAVNGECTVNSSGEQDIEPLEDLMGDNEDWMTFRMITTDNPGIDPKEVTSAAADMDEQSYLQEYFSHFIDYNGQAWVYVFKDRNLQAKVFVETRPVRFDDYIYLSFDFNKVPMTALVMQKQIFDLATITRTKMKYAPIMKKAFKLGDNKQSATIYDTCKSIREWIFAETGQKVGKWETRDSQGNILETKRYPNPFPFRVTGDASGNVTSGMVKDPTTYYKIIKDELGLPESAFRDIPKKNPFHADSHLQVNTLFSRCPGIQVDKVHCAELIKDFFRIKDDGKHGLMKGSSESNQADLLDCLRYMFNTFCDDIWTK